MVSTPLGLGVSPGWTKPQATEQNDQSTEKTCKAFQYFNSVSNRTGQGSDTTYDKKRLRHAKITLNTAPNHNNYMGGDSSMQLKQHQDLKSDKGDT